MESDSAGLDLKAASNYHGLAANGAPFLLGAGPKPPEKALARKSGKPAPLPGTGSFSRESIPLNNLSNIFEANFD